MSAIVTDEHPRMSFDNVTKPSFRELQVAHLGAGVRGTFRQTSWCTSIDLTVSRLDDLISEPMTKRGREFRVFKCLKAWRNLAERSKGYRRS
jgi:hypothetical protein